MCLLNKAMSKGTPTNTNEKMNDILVWYIAKMTTGDQMPGILEQASEAMNTSPYL